MKKVEILIQSIKEHHFSRELLFKDGLLKCDCSGLITYLLKQTNYFPDTLNSSPRVIDFFQYATKQGPKTKVQELKPYDCLMWRKGDIPKTGDSGHILLLKGEPKKISEEHFVIPILDVTRESGLKEREIDIFTDLSGEMWGVRWSENQKKVKKTPLLAYSFFQRKICSSCHFPKERCLCAYLPAVKPKAPNISILRHPSEKKHPFGTWPLLNLFFDQLITLEDEVFPPLTGTLIYPDHAEIPLGPLISLEEAQGPFIFIDATWKKSKKILFQNPWLCEAPRLHLPSLHPSRYKIRKQPKDEYVSTLEAVHALWELIEPSKKKEQESLLQLFNQFNKDQMIYSPNI